MDVWDIRAPKWMRKLFHIKTIHTIVIVSGVILFLSMVLSVINASLFGEEAGERYAVFEIVFLLFIAILGEVGVKYLRLPSAIVLMLLGILLSNSFLHLLFEVLQEVGLVDLLESYGIHASPPEVFKDEYVLEVMAQLGAIILLFKVGLHSSLKEVFAKENWLPAFLGVVLPFGAGYLYAINTGGSFAYAMFLGASLVATSVGITVAVLKELRLLREKFAKVIIGAAVLDDILGLLVLTFVLSVTNGGGGGAIISTIISTLAFFIGGIVVGQWFVEKYLDRKAFSSRRFLASLAFVFLYAYIAESIGLSAIVGAFLAGLVLTKSKHKKEVEEKTDVLELLFVPVFFVSLGLLVDVKALWEFAVPITIVTAIAMITKAVGAGLGAKLSGLSWLDSALVGIGMSPRGEVALIVAAIGLTAGVLTAAEYTLISAVALLTTIIAPPIMVYLLRWRKEHGPSGSWKGS